jgi:nicotinate-nucleotide adenylyltransferase
LRVGVLGGTFDPPHLGHLVVASEAHHVLDLDAVLFVPAGHPWHKQRSDLSPADVRAELVAAAIADDPRFVLSRVDLDRPGPTYTVDTLADLRRDLGPDAALLLLVGADALQGIPQWHEAHRIPELAQVVRVSRPGHDAPPPTGWEGVIDLPVPLIGISSTDCRERFRSGLPMHYLVPDRVLDVMRARGLYGGAA